MTTDDDVAINDLADACAVLDPDATRDDHLTCLLVAAEKLGIPTDLDAALTDEQAEDLHQWWSEL